MCKKNLHCFSSYIYIYIYILGGNIQELLFMLKIRSVCYFSSFSSPCSSSSRVEPIEGSTRLEKFPFTIPSSILSLSKYSSSRAWARGLKLGSGSSSARLFAFLNEPSWVCQSSTRLGSFTGLHVRMRYWSYMVSYIIFLFS